ncbi:MAG: hypothetical protein KC592_19305, partial [Nitrospira sp.]|nr:hypothetical protein [Nitrospira sp.]
PKTRSGKIMRLVLKTKELSQDPGDISTLEERVLTSCDSLFDQCFYLGPLTLNQRTAQSFIRKFRRQISWEL